MIVSVCHKIIIDKNPAVIDMFDQAWTIMKGRHHLYLKSPEEFEEIKNSEWYKPQRQSNKDILDGLFTASININKRDIKYNISAQDNSDFYSLEEAIEILSKPLSIVVENIEYDKFFIETLFKHFKEESVLINLHYKNGWIIFENGGGNNIPNVINERKKRFEENKVVFTKDSSKYLRMFIIIDSDKKYPSEKEIADDKSKLLDNIKYYNIPYWVTKKREMENYLPDEAFREISYNEEYINAYLKLRPEQKDFFDIEKGFPDINFDKLDPELKDLYSNLEGTEDFKTLRKEKMQFYSEHPKKASFKAEFPKMFLKSDKVTRTTLTKRANSSELEQILNKIKELL